MGRATKQNSNSNLLKMILGTMIIKHFEIFSEKNFSLFISNWIMFNHQFGLYINIYLFIFGHVNFWIIVSG